MRSSLKQRLGVYAPVARSAVRLGTQRKWRGGNITVKQSQSWASFWTSWEWDNWIRPQVDRAAALGMNAVRVICAPDVVVFGAISQATYNARLVQLAAYCQSRDIALYPCLCEQWAFSTNYSAPYSFQAAGPTAVVTSSAAAVAPYVNVIGFDLFQEGSGQSNGLVVADVVALYAAVRAAAPGVPLTTSNSSGGFGSAAGFWSDTASLPYQAWTATGGADFIDIHVYLDNVVPADLDAFLARVGKPVLLGEFGIGQDQTSGLQTARFKAIAALHNRRGVLGSLVWALADQSSTASAQFGVWDNTGYSLGSSPLSTTSGKRSTLTDILGSSFNIFEAPNSPQAPTNLVPAKTARPRNSTAGWATGSNTYVFTDERGLGFSATAAGTTSVGTSPATAIPVKPSTYYRGAVEVLAGATARTISFGVDWYDSSGTYILSATARTAVNDTIAPTKIETIVRSHSSAAYGVLTVKTTTASGTPVANEPHTVLNASLVAATDAA